MHKTSILVALLLSSAIAGQAFAQSNLETLGAMKRTEGATFTHIDQDGDRAASLRDMLQYINVPGGFEASLYAVVPDARSMALAPQGTALFVGTRKDKVWTVVDRDRVADEVMDFPPR
jgi:hypothetical protein